MDIFFAYKCNLVLSKSMILAKALNFNSIYLYAILIVITFYFYMKEQVRKNLNCIKYSLLSYFPDLDLRLTIIAGETIMRCSVFPDNVRDKFFSEYENLEFDIDSSLKEKTSAENNSFVELDLLADSSDKILQDAILKIKMLTNFFDS